MNLKHFSLYQTFILEGLCSDFLVKARDKMVLGKTP